MAEQRRAHKVAEQIRSIVATALYDLDDQRLRLVTITGAVVSRDLRHAKIYWNATGGAERRDEVEGAFQAWGSQLRHAVAQKLSVRFVPTLDFFYDETLDTADEVSRLLERVKRSEG
jgi:ribosome-binding factor A